MTLCTGWTLFLSHVTQPSPYCALCFVSQRRTSTCLSLRFSPQPLTTGSRWEAGLPAEAPTRDGTLDVSCSQESFGQLTRSEFLPSTLLQESPQFAQPHTRHFASLPSFSPSLTLFSFCAKDCRCFPVGHSGATHSLRALLSAQNSFETERPFHP